MIAHFSVVSSPFNNYFCEQWVNLEYLYEPADQCQQREDFVKYYSDYLHLGSVPPLSKGQTCLFPCQSLLIALNCCVPGQEKN